MGGRIERECHETFGMARPNSRVRSYYMYVCSEYGLRLYVYFFFRLLSLVLEDRLRIRLIDGPNMKLF